MNPQIFVVYLILINWLFDKLLSGNLNLFKKSSTKKLVDCR